MYCDKNQAILLIQVSIKTGFKRLQGRQNGRNNIILFTIILKTHMFTREK